MVEVTVPNTDVKPYSENGEDAWESMDLEKRLEELAGPKDVKCKFCGTPINSANSLETNDGWVCSDCADSEYWGNEDFVGFCEGCGKALYRGDVIYEGNEASEDKTDFYCEKCWKRLNS